MLKNYLKISFRNFIRSKVYSSINIIGLSIGLSVFILIMLFVQYQLSFDNFYKNSDRIYRVVWQAKSDQGNSEYAMTPELLAPLLNEQFPQIKSVVRIEKHYPEKALVSYGNKKFYETDFLHADSTFFNIFTLKFLKGNPKDAFSNPNSLVITSSKAKKYFGSENPVGKTLTVDNDTRYSISGVIKDVPLNSHFHFNFLAYKQRWTNSEWFMYSAYTYILLKKGYSSNDIEKQIPAFIDRNVSSHGAGVKASKTASLLFQPLKSIHLHSNLEYEIESNGDIRYVNIFSAIAFFILLIACINYTNISTSKYLRRITEIGVRKTLGASRANLKFQILTESNLISFISLLIAVGIVEVTQRVITNFTGIVIPPLSYGGNYLLLLFLLILAIVTGIISGLYPAFYVSRFSPSQILKKSASNLPFKLNFRKILIVFQFTIAVIIIIATSVFFSQLHFLENKRLGLDKENVIIINDHADALYSHYNTFKNELSQNPTIISVTSGDEPGENGGFFYSLNENGKPFTLRIIDADFDFVKTLGLQLKEGRTFRPIGDSSCVLINETCARLLNSKNFLGTELGKNFKRSIGKIIGVVGDFNMHSLRELITPMAIRIRPAEHGNVIIRIKPNSIRKALSGIKKKWKVFVKNRPLLYSFLNDDLNKLYTSDERLARLFGIFAFVSIFIALIGLFGISSLVTEQRTKEIGIRKVLGASFMNILAIISNEFIFLIIIANVLAFPITYYTLNKWLENYAYRITLGPIIFFSVALLSLLIAILAVSYQTIKAANLNPVESLRNE